MTRMLLSTARQLLEEPGYRCHQFFPEDLIVGNLFQITDEVLAAGKIKGFSADQATFLLPLIGAIDIVDQTGEKLVGTGALHPVEGAFRIKNPYEDRQVNYLRFHLENERTEISGLTSEKGNLQKIIETESLLVFIGLYDGRTKSTIPHPFKKLYACALNGAFEFQDRLLETRDGLFFDTFEAIEFESLSGAALLLIALEKS